MCIPTNYDLHSHWLQQLLVAVAFLETVPARFRPSVQRMGEKERGTREEGEEGMSRKEGTGKNAI